MRHSSITAKGDTAQILIYEDIGEDFFGGLGAKAFVEQLAQIPASVTNLNVRINSDGGDVFEGAAIYNALKDHPAKKNVIIDGIAASIASVIAMAGDTITIQPTAMMMIHNARAVAGGDCNGLRQVADLLETVNGQMAIAYSRNAKQDTPGILAIMGKETWYTSQGAVDAGWADALVATPLKMAASLQRFDQRAFANAPDWAKQLRAASPKADDGCSCPCSPCIDGDCPTCDHDGCECAGCTGCGMALEAVAKASGKSVIGDPTGSETAENDRISAENEEKRLIIAQKRAEKLRLARES